MTLSAHKSVSRNSTLDRSKVSVMTSSASSDAAPRLHDVSIKFAGRRQRLLIEYLQVRGSRAARTPRARVSCCENSTRESLGCYGVSASLSLGSVTQLSERWICVHQRRRTRRSQGEATPVVTHRNDVETRLLCWWLGTRVTREARECCA